MACWKPLKGWIRGQHASGKPKIVFKKAETDFSNAGAVSVPCGQCSGCRLQHSANWAVRCMHEAQTQDQNAFITLTYSPEHLPRDFSLDKSHFQDFMKRLRYHFDGDTVRYFHCGEYGENLSRPHYHACLFGIDFPDKLFYKRSASGEKIYTSDLLETIWGRGFCTVGDVTFNSAAYVARYVTKKITGLKAVDHYVATHPMTGEVFDIEPEYVTMSRRPGIAKEWFMKYREEVYPNDEVLVNGHLQKPPRYYDKLFEEHHGDLEAVKKQRIAYAESKAENNTPSRLRVREICQQRRLQNLKRGFEDGE